MSDARAAARLRRIAIVAISSCLFFRAIHFVVLAAYREISGPIQPWPDSQRQMYVLATLLGTVVTLLAGVCVFRAYGPFSRPADGRASTGARIYTLIASLAMIPFLCWDFKWCITIIGTN